MYDGARPSDRNLAALSEALSPEGDQPGQVRLLSDLRRLYWVSDIVEVLAGILDPGVTEEIIVRLRAYAGMAEAPEHRWGPLGSPFSLPRGRLACRCLTQHPLNAPTKIVTEAAERHGRDPSTLLNCKTLYANVNEDKDFARRELEEHFHAFRYQSLQELKESVPRGSLRHAKAACEDSIGS